MERKTKSKKRHFRAKVSVTRARTEDSRESWERMSGQTRAEPTDWGIQYRTPRLSTGHRELGQAMPASTEPPNNKELVTKTRISCFSVTVWPQSWEQLLSKSEEGGGRKSSEQTSLLTPELWVH